jgi:hypothetical protein
MMESTSLRFNLCRRVNLQTGPSPKKWAVSTERWKGGKAVQGPFRPSRQRIYSTERQENACAVRSVHVGEAPVR